MKRNQGFQILLWTIIVTGTAALTIWLIGRANQNVTDSNGSSQSVIASYKVLNDDMTSVIRIGVDWQINDQDLRSTLAKAADEHQDDAARDYLTSTVLWVEAYLLKNGQQSTIPAGTLRRPLPPGNPAQRRTITTDRGKSDSFTITVDEARDTL